MKIEKNLSRPENPKFPGELEGRRDPFSSPKGAFQSALSQARAQQEAGQLLAAVEEQAERLKKKMDLLELRRYQEQVRRFLQHVLGGAYHFREKYVRDRRGRQRSLAMVDVIDRELEELAALIVREEKDRLAILEKIDQIRGLLLDCYS